MARAVGGRVAGVLVAQLPPPVHGQAAACALLAATDFPRLDLAVVPMDMSTEVAEVGRFRPAKVARLGRVVASALRARAAGRGDVLVYAVGLGNLVAVVRDVIALGLLRPWFGATVLHVHTGASATHLAALPQPLRVLARLAYRRAAVIYLDPSLGTAIDGLPAPRSVAFLPYGIVDPCPSPPAHPPARPGVGSATPVRIAFLGNLYESKGTTALLAAAARLHAEGVAFELVLAGGDPDGATVDRLTRTAEALGIAGLVDVVGPRYGPAKDELLARADVFCFPTSYEAEGMPLVVLEAMAHGLPVVATAWRAIPALVVDGVTGVLVRPGDETSLVDALRRVVTDTDLRHRMGAAGRRRFLAYHDAPTFTRAFEAIVVDAARTPDVPAPLGAAAAVPVAAGSSR